MKASLRRFLFAFFALLSITVSAQKLYWVGGTGNFNDANHWSFESGGQGGAKSPAATDDVYFDENSFFNKSIISFIGQTEVHDLVFTQYTAKVIFSGTQNEKIIVHGNLALNAYIDNQFEGDIWLNPTQFTTSVFFSLTKCKGSLYFNGVTNWNLVGNIITDDNSSVFLKSGKFDLTKVGIYSGNFIVSSGVTINANHSTLKAVNKFVIPAGVTVNDTRSHIFAYTKDAVKFQVDPTVTFNSNSRYHDLFSVASCSVTNTGKTDPTCAGSCNGTMTFVIPAGCNTSSNPVYAVWNTGVGCTVVPTGTLTPGTTYTVGGICGCGTQYSVIFTNDPIAQDSVYGQFAISIADPVPARVISFILKQPTCFGSCNGKVIAVLNTFGQLPISIAWTSSSFAGTVTHSINNHTKDTLYNACAGTYTVVLTDGNGCVSTASVTTLAQPTDVVSTITTTNVSCFGSCTGVITNTPSGGTGAITCSLNGAAMAGCTASGLCGSPAPGTTYTVIATDANGCKDTTHPILTSPTNITFTKNPASGALTINCLNTCNGSIGVTGVTGGAGGYTYAWAPAGGSVTSTSTTSTYSGLCGSVAGITYTCTITDASSCTVTATFTVTSPPALTHTITGTNPKCAVGQGVSTGSMTVTEGGGSPAPYTFTWTPAFTVTGASPTSNNTGAPAGTYSVMITDTKGCKDSATVTLLPPVAVTGTITTTTNPQCPGLNNGQLCVTAGGGTPFPGPVYTYAWSPFGGTASCSTPNLTVPAGGTANYTVTITDANTCTLSVTGTMTSPPQATVTPAITQVKCGSAPCTGSATLNVAGAGVGGSTFAWSCTASTLNNISGQCAGSSCNYTVTDVTTNCKNTGTVSFAAAPTVLNVSISSTTLACNGNCNAVITSTVSGGTGSITYSWTGTGATPVVPTATTQVGMCAGNYTLTVTDANLCTNTTTLTIAAPPVLTNTIVATNPTCVVAGSATVTQGGGTAPYTFTWSPLGGTQASATANPNTYTGIPAGSYTVLITDSKGCLDTATITLTPPPVPTGTITTTINPQCPGLNNGQLCVTPGGGTPGYTFAWSPAPASGTLSCTAANLTVPAGGTKNYTVTITDANSCTVTVTGTMTSPPQATITPTITQVKCGSAPCTGSATLTTAGGGGGAFTYTWSCAPGNTTPIVSGQCAGSSCNYTVTDVVTNCKYTGTVSFIAAPPTLTVNISATALNCNGDCSSTITSTVTGGTGPNTYAWSGTGATPVVPTATTQVNMCAGNYTLCITDALGCTQCSTLTIASPPALTVTMVPTQPSCGNSCDGCILATPTGGSGVFPGVSWSPSVIPPTTLNPCNLCGLPAPGQTYTLTITDSKGCTGIGNTTLINPSSLTITVSTGSITCSGLCNGTATATVSGGVSPFTYSWDGGVFTNSVVTSGLCVGPHTLDVKDVNGCTGSTIAFNIIAPSPISACVANQVNTCGPCTGSADASCTTGGTAPYTYTWTPGNGNAPTTSGLCVGPYTLTVGDANSCPTSSTTFTITHIVSVNLAASSQSVSCNNGCDGVATVTASGGTPNYNMIWTSSPANTVVTSCLGVPSTCSTPNTLCPGTYVISVTDAVGCTNRDSIIIGNPPVLTATVTQTNVLCFGTCTGSATVTPSGGTPGYSINWSDIGGVAPSPRSGLCAAPAPPITYTVTDSRGCQVIQSFTITSKPQFTVTPTITSPTVCGGNGTIVVTASGGTAGYTFTWTPPLNGGIPTSATPSSTLSPIPAGVYTVTITDFNGCGTVAQIALSDPGTQTVTITTQSVSCFGISDGSATVTAVGVPNITITWPVGPVVGTGSLAVSGQAAGIYQVTTVDGNGCTVIVPDTIKGPTKIIDNPTFTQPNCSTTGSITLTPTGGTGGYTFNWDGLPGTNIHSGLLPGTTHTCIISDATPCSQTYTYTMGPISSPTITLTQTNVLCFGASTGSATVTVAGGSGPFTWTWTNSTGVFASGTGATVENNLAVGPYTVSVVDGTGCTTQQTFTITSPPVIVPNLTSTNNLCNIGQGNPCSGTASAIPTGGTSGTYTYTWINVTGSPITPSITGVCPGSYSLIVTDSNNCQVTQTFTVSDPLPLTFTINATNPACHDQCSGTATVTASGGTGITYTFTWNGLQSPSTVSNLCGTSGTQYTVAVIDSNSCTNTQFYTPINPTQISSITTSVTPKCVNDANGSITTNTSGGTSPYVYAWSPLGGTVSPPASPVSTYTNIGAGTYTVNITDFNGCKDSVTVTLSNPGGLILTSSVTSPSCGLNNGCITITSTSGGTAPITVSWLPPSVCGAALSCCGLSAGIYSVELTDAIGCKDTSTIALSNANGPQISSFVTNVNCNNTCNGSIFVAVTSGVNVITPYSFTWTPTAPPGTITTTTNTSTFSNICPNTYICTVADSAGCQTSTTFTISEPTPITDVGNSTPATCVGINDGTIKSIGSGGTPGTSGYTYSIDGGLFLSPPTFAPNIFNGVAAGSHTVCISDSVGCTKCFTVTINTTNAILSVLSFTNSTCFNSNNGSISLTSFGGGTSPYTVAWSNLQTGTTIINLGAGPYTYTITDNLGCKAINTATVVAPAAIVPNTVIVSPACGLCNGIITLTPTGGTPFTIPPAYTFTWSASGEHGASLDSVCAGLYDVIISDSIGCTQLFSIPVSNPGSPTVTTNASSPICGNACSGIITTTVVSASLPVTYLWLADAQTGSSHSNLCSAPDSVYFLQVKDAAGCIATVSDTINSGIILDPHATVVNPPCDSATGSIATNVTGGSGTYTYFWIPGGAITSGIGPVVAGAYTLVVTDVVNGCVDTIPIGLNSSSNVPILTATFTDALCHGLCTGTASVSIFGGASPYVSNWSNGQLGTTFIDSLCPNVYVVTVTDGAGCVTTASVVVSEPDTLIRSLPIITQPRCFNDTNGSIQTIIAGGTPIYTYAWSPATVTGTGGNNLGAGNYSVTITDANGCSITEFDTLLNPTLLTITGTVTPSSCNITPNAAINTTTNGGTPTPTVPGYTYTWSGGSTATTPNLAGILVGTYTVLVTDSRNCKDSANFVVTSAVNITVDAGNDTTLCSIPSFVLAGDTTGATSMQWIQLPNPPLNVIGTTLNVTVTPTPGDTTQYVLIAMNGACSNSDTIRVITNVTPMPDAGAASVIFIGQPTTIGGSPTNPGGGTIVWHPTTGLSDSTAANPSITPQVTTQYTVYVTNAAGCIGWDTVTVTVLPTFVIPNGFSPNGDGYNETWQIDYIYMFPNCEVEVYNRWGEQLFYSKGYNTPWSGKYNGKDVPVGTYYYVIRLNDKRFPDHFAGPLTILR